MSFSSSNPMLMLIDLQKAIDDPSWGIRNNPKAEMEVSRLLEFWRGQNLPILHVKHMSVDPHSKYFPGTSGNNFKEITAPLESEQILEKNANSAFIRTNLDLMLQEKGISELVIVGVITNNSVEATVRMAGNLGYAAIVVSDATYTFNQTDLTGQEHPAELVHNMSLANMNDEYAKVCNTNEVLSTADKFK